MTNFRTLQYEQLLKSELKTFWELNSLQSPFDRGNIKTLPVYDYTTKLSRDGTFFKVQGVTEPYFDRLNNQLVVTMSLSQFQKRKKGLDGKFVKASNGDYVFETVVVKRDSMLIFSTENIHLPAFEMKGGQKVRRDITSGFEFVDYCDVQNTRLYMYMLPKKNLILCHRNALLVSYSRRLKHYGGYQFKAIDGSDIFYYVVPYTASLQRDVQDASNFKVLGVDVKTDFTVEIKANVDYLISRGILFSTTLGANVQKLTATKIQGTLLAEEYNPYATDVDDLNVAEFFNS